MAFFVPCGPAGTMSIITACSEAEEIEEAPELALAVRAMSLTIPPPPPGLGPRMILPSAAQALAWSEGVVVAALHFHFRHVSKPLGAKADGITVALAPGL